METYRRLKRPTPKLLRSRQQQRLGLVGSPNLPNLSYTDTGTIPSATNGNNGKNLDFFHQALVSPQQAMATAAEFFKLQSPIALKAVPPKGLKIDTTAAPIPTQRNRASGSSSDGIKKKKKKKSNMAKEKRKLQQPLPIYSGGPGVTQMSSTALPTSSVSKQPIAHPAEKKAETKPKQKQKQKQKSKTAYKPHKHKPLQPKAKLADDGLALTPLGRKVDAKKSPVALHTASSSLEAMKGKSKEKKAVSSASSAVATAAVQSSALAPVGLGKAQEAKEDSGTEDELVDPNDIVAATLNGLAEMEPRTVDYEGDAEIDDEEIQAVDLAVNVEDLGLKREKSSKKKKSKKKKKKSRKRKMELAKEDDKDPDWTGEYTQEKKKSRSKGKREELWESS